MFTKIYTTEYLNHDHNVEEHYTLIWSTTWSSKVNYHDNIHFTITSIIFKENDYTNQLMLMLMCMNMNINMNIDGPNPFVVICFHTFFGYCNTMPIPILESIICRMEMISSPILLLDVDLSQYQHSSINRSVGLIHSSSL